MTIKPNTGTLATLGDLIDAMKGHVPVQLVYRDGSGNETLRTVEIYMIDRSRSGDWLVKAADRSHDGAHRSFRLDRIRYYFADATDVYRHPSPTTVTAPTPAAPPVTAPTPAAPPVTAPRPAAVTAPRPAAVTAPTPEPVPAPRKPVGPHLLVLSSGTVHLRGDRFLTACSRSAAGSARFVDSVRTHREVNCKPCIKTRKPAPAPAPKTPRPAVAGPNLQAPSGVVHASGRSFDGRRAPVCCKTPAAASRYAFCRETGEQVTCTRCARELGWDKPVTVSPVPEVSRPVRDRVSPVPSSTMTVTGSGVVGRDGGPVDARVAELQAEVRRLSELLTALAR